MPAFLLIWLAMKLLSSDAIRRCLVADPGKVILSADFDQIELRVIAGLAGEETMIEAAKRGESLHHTAAVQLFGENYTPDEYKRTKNINFTWAFGGGASTMTRRYGIPLSESQALVRQYETAFPALVRFKRREQEKVIDGALNSWEKKRLKELRSRKQQYRADTPEGAIGRAQLDQEIRRLLWGKTASIETPTGRWLIVDAHKPYAVVNYLVQSSAADILKEAFIRVMDDPELEPTVLLPVHDELIGQAYKKVAGDIAIRYGEVMSCEFYGVPLTATGKVYGRSWGHGYRKQD